jgi:hypothetical protein
LLAATLDQGNPDGNHKLWNIPHSWVSTGSVTRLTQRVSLVEQELLTLSEHLSSPPVFNEVRVTWSIVWCVCFIDRFCPFSFGHCIVCSSSIYADLQTLQYSKKKKKYNIIFNNTLLKQLHCNIKCYLSCLSVWTLNKSTSSSESILASPLRINISIDCLQIFKLFLNSDGQQFHQYQQNEQSLLTLTHWTQKKPWHNDGNPGPCFRQAQQNVVGLNRLMRTQSLHGW